MFKPVTRNIFRWSITDPEFGEEMAMQFNSYQFVGDAALAQNGKLNIFSCGNHAGRRKKTRECNKEETH